MYPFIIKQISPSRKEVRIKLKDVLLGLDENGAESNEILHLKQELNSGTDSYSHEWVLNIGTGNHIRITNYHFDNVTDGVENQSIILRLYEPLPLTITSPKLVTIEKEVFITQTQEFYYVVDEDDLITGDGLTPDDVVNWINPSENESYDYENLNELSQSLTENNFQQLTSGSVYDYPNLNTDFRFFSNHTFFGSAAKKLQNFKTKVETIQSHYTNISSSLSVSSSVDGDSTAVINLRKDLFNKIRKEINSFTPYERFLYYDGQSESTASAPGLGKNYADTIPVSTIDYQGQINGGDGFDVVYHHSNKDRGADEYVDLFTNKYYVHDAPFFNYSSSIYLSFLMKADSGSALSFENRQKAYSNDGGDVSFPQDSKFKENILNPIKTGSAYQRYVFHTSHSYFIPTAEVSNDFSRINNFSAGSTEIEILSGSFKTGSTLVKDSSGKYKNYSTVVTGSGIKFKGSVMPAGELFRIFYKFPLSSSLQGYMNFDSQTSGSVVTDDMMLRVSAEGSGTLENPGPAGSAASPFSSVMIGDGVEVHGRKYGQSVQFVSESRHELDFDDEKFNFGRDDNFSLSIWAKRFHPATGSADAIGKHGDDGDPDTDDAFGSGSSNIFGRGSTAISYGITYDQSTNRIRAGVRGQTPIGGSGDTSNTVTHTMTDDLLDWHHIVFTYESGSSTGLKLYIDGNLKNSKTTLAPNFDITGSYNFTASNYSNEPLAVGGNEIVGGNNVFYSGFLQYPRVYDRTLTADEVQQLYLVPDGISDSKITDVKITLEDPRDVLPFDFVYKTTSTKWTNWYNGMVTRAKNFDTNNIHSLENNLPTYIQESSEYDDLKDFLKLQGEQYDIVRNHIDSMGTIHDRGYKKTNSAPSNAYPMLLDNLGYQAINPFSGSLEDSLSKYLTSVTSIDDIKNNTWRKTLNNLLYIYKTKGTINSVRGLLNVYGYPPDVIPMNELGAPSDIEEPFKEDNIIDDSVPPNDDTIIDTDLDNETGSVRFRVTKEKLYKYLVQNNENRVLNLDWWMDSADINTIEFIYQHGSTTNNQTILTSTGSGNQKMWDLTLVPSSDGISSSFQFRLNNSNSGSLAIASNALSMSTNYSKMTDGQLWNVMLQRMTGSISGSGINEYRLHVARQNNKKIEVYNYVTMSVNGGSSPNTYVTGGASTNYYANQNWLSTGSRDSSKTGNLRVGDVTFTGSLSQIKTWTTALSRSKFRRHTFNKFSTVGNSIDSYEKELVYHFRLNENYSTSSISASNQFLTIVDSAPKTNLTTDYSFQMTGSLFTGSVVYGFDLIDKVFVGSNDDITLNSENDNKIIINPKNNLVGNLSPFGSIIKNNDKPLIKPSTTLELDKSPTNYINQYILNHLDGFNLENFYGDPKYYYSASYREFDDLRNNFFTAHPISIDTNKFIRSHENIFNHSLTEGLKTLVPARSTLSDKNSSFGVTIKQNILEKNKYEHKKYSVEVNPNLVSGSINFVENTEYKQQSFVASFELPYSASISLGDAYATSSKYVNPSFLFNQYSASIEFPKTGSSINVNEVISLSTTTINFPHSSSISMGNSYSANRGYINPPFLQSDGLTGSLELPYSSSINEIPTRHNKSFVNIHDSWGTSSADTHFINFAGGTGSEANYNVGHIDTRNVFHMIGDTEHYSSSYGKASDFGDERNFNNRRILTEGAFGLVRYQHLTSKIVVPLVKHNVNKGFEHVGTFLGKTRFFREHVDSNGDIKMVFPSNHVSNFANNFKDTMYAGTQNTNPGLFPKTSKDDKDVDFSTASFYRVNVTGGENQIIIKSGPGTIGEDDSINY